VYELIGIENGDEAEGVMIKEVKVWRQRRTSVAISVTISYYWRMFVRARVIICIQTEVAQRPQLNKFYPHQISLLFSKKKIVSLFLYKHFGE
jgi:hypothetical protein